MLRKFFKVLKLSTVPIFLHGLRYGVAATIENRDALKGGNYKTVVDIGANKGQFALLARGLFPRARIFSFEPLDEPCQKFRRVFGEDQRTTLFQSAVGPSEQDATMYVSRSDDSSSLLPIAEQQTRIFPDTGLSHTAVVSMTTLGQVLTAGEIEAPALLKLDVQGYELEALKGCETLLGCFESIYVECSFVELYEGQPLIGEVIAYLRDRDFDLSGVYNVAYDRSGRPVQADLLLAR